LTQSNKVWKPCIRFSKINLLPNSKPRSSWKRATCFSFATCNLRDFLILCIIHLESSLVYLISGSMRIDTLYYTKGTFFYQTSNFFITGMLLIKKSWIVISKCAINCFPLCNFLKLYTFPLNWFQIGFVLVRPFDGLTIIVYPSIVNGSI